MLGVEGVIANGLRTDHPIPGLPFVDDTHLPLPDPHAIERLGRNRGHDRWGRTDAAGRIWKAYTTDPYRADLAWVIHSHPDFGRSVWLALDDDAASIYAEYNEYVIVVRAGGYWWDGGGWYRPPQIFDRISEEFTRRSVPGAGIISVADLFAGEMPTSTVHSSVPLGTIPTTGDYPLEGQALDDDAWRAQLSEAWLAARANESLPLNRCVVDVAAPELSPDALLSVADVASQAGIAASTLRSYITRGQNDVPSPQATVSGRSMWAQPVIDEWLEERNRDPEALADKLATYSPLGGREYPPGITRLWERSYSKIAALIRELGPRMSLPWRNGKGVQQLAQSISWFTVASPDALERLLPVRDVGIVTRKAIWADIVYSLELQTPQVPHGQATLVLAPETARLLVWFISHYPKQAARRLEEAASECEERDIDRGELGRAARSAVTDPRVGADESIIDFIDQVLGL